MKHNKVKRTFWIHWAYRVVDYYDGPTFDECRRLLKASRKNRNARLVGAKDSSGDAYMVLVTGEFTKRTLRKALNKLSI